MKRFRATYSKELFSRSITFYRDNIADVVSKVQENGYYLWYVFDVIDHKLVYEHPLMRDTEKMNLK